MHANAYALRAARLRLIFDGLLTPGRRRNAALLTATRSLVSSRRLCDNADTISWTTPGNDDASASGLAAQDVVGNADPSSMTSSSADARRQSIFFYVDTVFPLKLGIWDIRYALAEVEKENLLERIKQRIPKDTGHSFRVEAIEARQKDGVRTHDSYNSFDLLTSVCRAPLCDARTYLMRRPTPGKKTQACEI